LRGVCAGDDLAHLGVDEAGADDPGLDPVVVVGVLDDLGQGAQGVLADAVGSQARDDDDAGLAADVDHAAEAACLHPRQDSRAQGASGTLSKSAGLGSLQVMTVCDLSSASSVVCAERFRTVAKSFTAGAHTPADPDGFYVRAIDAHGHA
jgi:hypothetical protein